MYCKKCGGKVDSYASHCPFCGEPIASNSVQATYTASNSEGAQVTKGVGSWILTYIIMCIPVLNIIMLFVWSFGGKTKANPTFRNWARAILLIEIIGLVLVIAGTVVLYFLAPDVMQEYIDKANSIR